VTRLISLNAKGKEKDKRGKRREAAQWRMKYSLEYDGFYYKNRVTHEVSWEDPRPSLLDQADYESFVAKRTTLRASMRAGALAGLGGPRASSQAMMTVDEGTREGSSDEREGGEAGGEEKREKKCVWRVKYSAAYGCNYYKNKINNQIVWEDPR